MSAEHPALGGGSPAEAILADLASLGGAGLEVVELPVSGEPAAPAGAVRVGVHRSGPLPTGPLETFDILLSADPGAPRPWVGVAPERLAATLAALEDQVARYPVAAAVAAQVMRMTLRLDFAGALALESFAYSMLLASAEFRAWRAGRPVRTRAEETAPRVLVDAAGPVLRLELNRPGARNAFDARMRDALAEALEFAALHPDAPQVILSGRGPSFSAGGDLDEFGQADDVGRAHLIRTLRSPTRLAHEIRERVSACVHGACIGAGIEIPASAGRLTARPDAYFRLPEVAMGLIPGAGGTASIPRRIGRRRACFMAISGLDVDVQTALAWGLVDAVEP